MAPALKQLCDELGWSLPQVELICVAQGPGSFTGLRVGLATAKILAYLGNKQIVGVNTLEVLATQISHPSGAVRPVIDAQRKQLFTASYQHRTPSERESARPILQETSPTNIIGREEFVASLKSGDTVCGPGLSRIEKQLNSLSDEIVIERDNEIPNASTVGLIGHRRFLSGTSDDVFAIAPNYYRLSAAEEKAAEEKAAKTKTG